MTALCIVLVWGCARGSKSGGSDGVTVKRVTVAGSTALLPLVTDVANRYMREHRQVAIEASAGGSRQGIARVLRGEIAIGTSDLYADEAIASKLEDHKVAIVGFAAMANRGAFNEKIESLTLTQLHGIFSGKVRNWSELGGEDQPLVVINRGKDSGTRVHFGKIVLGDEAFAEGHEEESSALVQTSLEQTPGSISYLALSYRRETLKCFAVDGVAPTAANVAAGRYPIRAYEHMYTLGPAKGEVRDFIQFVLSDRVQNELVAKSGFVPLASERGMPEQNP